MKIVEEKTFWGEYINSPEDFIEDLCDRINNVFNTVMNEQNKDQQLAYLIGFLSGFTNRLNRVCERTLLNFFNYYFFLKNKIYLYLAP